ncbi:MAG: FKBP-type peptidyl-prolyl cis-trans isomerase [bacterium]|nr:FKBP-type peptidyl-prolyl cis-trans isomerase [bacterium]MDP3380877.1 FKBP-type peptidyl-prolyl cis-trans isomerase [bacterium]
MNTSGYENNKLLNNTSMQEYPLILGSNLLVPGFEEQIIDAKIGDNLEFPVQFPADYHNEEFANKNTTFKVEIIKIEKSVKPEFTEEFIEQLRGKKLDLT